MMPDLLAFPQIERLGWVLLHALWQGALVALVLRAVLDALHESSADLRYAACLTALVLLVALPAATWLVLEPAGEVAAAPRIAEREVLRQSAPAWAAVVAGAAVQQALPVQRPDPQPWWWMAEARLRPLLPYVVFAWALGVVVLSLRMLGGWMQVLALRRHGLRAVPERWRERFGILARRLGIARPVALWASVRVDVPLTVGVLRPVVLVPVGFLTGLPPEQVEAILAHELAHVRRYDYLVNLLQVVVETLLFFHPAAWWVSRQLRTEREWACDDRAVAACRDRLVYARALTGVAERRGAGAWLGPAASDGSLGGRIRRLVAPAESGEAPWGRVAVAGVVLLLTLAVVVGACAPRPVEDERPAEQAPVVAETERVEPDGDEAAPDGNAARVNRVTSTRGDTTESDVLVVRADTDSVDVAVRVERLRRRADSLRQRHERIAWHVAREMDSLHTGTFRLRVDSLQRAAERMARWHVDSLRHAGFFARFDTLRLPQFDADYDFDFDSLTTPRIFFADSLTFRFDSLLALHDPGALRLRLDSLHHGFAWSADSVRVIFRRHEERLREREKRLHEQLRVHEPERLREQAERLEREAERLRRRAEELEDQ